MQQYVNKGKYLQSRWSRKYAECNATTDLFTSLSIMMIQIGIPTKKIEAEVCFILTAGHKSRKNPLQSVLTAQTEIQSTTIIYNNR
jgi:hypothetical protein